MQFRPKLILTYFKNDACIWRSLGLVDKVKVKMLLDNIKAFQWILEVLCPLLTNTIMFKLNILFTVVKF